MGCPHRCVFCNQTSITGQLDGRPSVQEVAERISDFLAYKRADRRSVEVAFYGGNFLGLPEDYRRALLEETQRFVETGRVDGVRFSTRPETITPETLDSLEPYAVKSVEVGVQSMDDTVLSLSRRGHTARDTEKAVEGLRNYGMKVGLQVMPGLPGDTAASVMETGRKVTALRPDFVRIYPTLVVRETVLEKWYLSGRFVPLSLDDAVMLSKELYLLFNAHGISVIRMGLQATENLSQSRALVAGPFHPAFGHLVYSAIFFDLAVRELEMLKPTSNRIVIRVHPRDVPKLRGLRNQNLEELVKRFNLEELQILPDQDVSENMLRVETAP
jgi:histone acetyltransferase (RNA polymerase elongator complex component)